MKVDDKIRKTVWTYAIVMFICAFVLLLFVGYNYINPPRPSGDTGNTQENSLTKSIKLITDENNKLKTENDTTKKELVDVKDELQKQKDKLNNLIETNDKIKKTFDSFVSAEIEYRKGNSVACTELLKNKVNYAFLGTDAKNKYNEMIKYMLNDAIYILYYEGRNQYWNDKYDAAIATLQRALKLTGKTGRADDITYYIAKSYYDKGDMVNAKLSLTEIMNSYKDSTIYNSAKKLLAKIK